MNDIQLLTITHDLVFEVVGRYCVMTPNTFLQRPTRGRKHPKMHGLLGCHHRLLRLMPLFWITAILSTTVNAFTFSDQRNLIHLSLQYNQRSPTWARISQDLNTLPRARRFVADQDEVQVDASEEKYNQRSPTWARISQDPNTLPRARRFVADQDEVQKDESEGNNFQSGQERTGNLSFRRIRSTPKNLTLSKKNQTESEVIDGANSPSKIQLENGRNDTGIVTESKLSKHTRKVEEKDLLASVAQQVSKIVSHKLLPAEGGHGKSRKKSRKSVHGGKGGKGHKSFHGHKSGKKGQHSEEGKKGFFDKGGQNKHGNHHEKDYESSYKGGFKSAKEHREGFKAKHRKGYRDKGFKNKHYKKEFGFKKNFHDEDAFFKHFANQDLFKDYFKDIKGGGKKHSGHKGHKSHSDHGTKGFFDEGHYHVDDHGVKKHHGNKGYHGHRSSHGHKDGR